MVQIDKVVLAAHALHTAPGTYAVLLGSGLSSAAGIPTGWEITRDLARRVAKIDDGGPDDPEEWYRSRFGTAPDYSVLLETLCPKPSERRERLRHYIEPTPEDRDRGRRVPTEAHRAVARLAASGHIRVILTTNFDRLIEAALTAAGVSFDVIATEDALAGARPIGHAPCVVVKLHGDYQDSRIRNTEEELAAYPDAFNALRDRVLDEYGLIICGWSATWDPALRDAIERQRSRRYTAWWVGLFAVGCAWDTNPLPFAEALKITADISYMGSGNEDLLHLRRYPALRCLYAGGIAAVYQQRWDTLRTLTLDATTTYRHYGPLPMATALDYWSMFRNLRTARFLPARHDIPVSHYLFETLREVLRGAVPVDHEYETAFDRFEYMLGLIIEDTRSQQPEGGRTGDAPVGYFIRYRHSTHTPPVWERIKSEAEQAGADWGPIRAGIFGGSIERFAAAEETYRNHVLKAW